MIKQLHESPGRLFQPKPPRHLRLGLRRVSSGNIVRIDHLRASGGPYADPAETRRGKGFLTGRASSSVPPEADIRVAEANSEIDPKRYKEVFDEFYAIAKVAIEEYELRANRILHRLKPLSN